jgi:cytochrome c oxidase cbb3-type subunit 3
MNNENEDAALVPKHEYDGIHELDNPLPTWWLITFFATIIFAFHYWLHYTVGGGQTQKEELKQDLSMVEATQAKFAPKLDSAEAWVGLAGDPKLVEAGHKVFSEKCAACHGPQAQGLIGPNLTDEYWLHGHGTLVDIAGVVRKGVLDKGMPTWEGVLSENELKAVVVFVASTAGSNPPNPKPAQGEKVERQ